MPRSLRDNQDTPRSRNFDNTMGCRDHSLEGIEPRDSKDGVVACQRFQHHELHGLSYAIHHVS